jgi:hypothetical protein
MKTINGRNGFSQNIAVILTRAFMFTGFLFVLIPTTVRAVGPGLPGGTNYSSYTPLDSWSFHDNTNWTSDLDDAPVSFTNLDFSHLGNGSSLVLDSTNPARLQYNVYENDGTTNITVDQGSVTFWFGPNWASTNSGGNGPGEYGRLLEIGAYTPDSSYGWWSIFVDDGGNNIYFAAQTNDLSSSITTYLSAPIAWTTNYFHFIALTYSATNTALYLDGMLTTNGPPLTVYPGPDVLANGFYIGSDSNGVLQAHGLFNTVETYNYLLDSNTVQQIFNWDYTLYMISPWNIPYMDSIVSAPSNPSGSQNYYDAITGQGGLQLIGSVSAISSTNIWITNVTASVNGNGMSLSFTIQGGSNSVPYDVFANSILDFSSDTNKAWAWMGQGYHGNTYMLTNLPNTACFLILGTPQDSDSDGLTDAYERLVSKTNPNVADTDGDGIPDAWEVLLGLNALVNDNAQPSSRSNYSYDFADWLEGISGIRSGSVSLDAEGNVLTVSQ